MSVLSPLELKLLGIAASASGDTRLIILDEPTWGIDVDGQVRLLEMLCDLVSLLHRPALLVISHDQGFLRSLGAQLFLFRDGTMEREG